MHDLSKTIEILERTPAVLRSVLLGVSGFWANGRYGQGTWCAYEVVGHLIVAERDDWMPRLRRILEHGEQRPFDPFAHDATVSPGSNIPLAGLLDEFESLRSTNLRDLRAMNMTQTDLSRTGIHPSLGRVTAAQLLSTWAVHDLHHIRQACLAMAWQYREAVGPWKAYLNTLSR
ncbi:MAG: DinB family protein [Planctomycetes bacterium]|nr:DinB family protein [Planctomycetota bacterium]